MLLRVGLAGLGFAVSFATFLAVPANAQQVGRIRCESRNYQPAACAVPGITDARIAQQLGGRCIEGQSWGHDRRGVYVSNGCRAVFDVQVRGNVGGYPGGGYPGGGYPGGYPGSGYPGGGYPGGGAQAIRCESQNYRQTRCAIDTRGGVQLQRVLGGSPCRQGQTWGYDRGGVWVTNGCRADFIVGGSYAGGGYPGGGYPGGSYPGGGYPGGGYPGGGYPGGYRSIDCSSMNYRPARCPIGNAGTVRIERVLGGECIEGRTWGHDRNSIWVNDGCRGRFRVN